MDWAATFTRIQHFAEDGLASLRQALPEPHALIPALPAGWDWTVVAAIAAGVLLLLLVIADVLTGGRFRFRGEFDPRPVLTPNEKEFYGRLYRALPDYIIWAQVSMSALIEPAVSRADPQFMMRRNRVAQKYVDFVVVNRSTLDPVAIIELDDITHDPAKDAKRDEMLEGAGYVVLRWHSRRKPSTRVIAKAVARAAREAQNAS
jgi:hypothetical protein